jgi:PAS domain S-box-containing protein
MNRQPLLRRALRNLGVVLLAMAAAVLARKFLLAELGPRNVWATFYPAVMLAALCGDWLAGLLAAGASCLIVIYAWSWFGNQLLIVNHGDWLGLSAFLCNCALISALVEAVRRARARAALTRLTAEIQRAKGEHWEAALLAAQINATPDGILIVDDKGNKLIQNRRCVELWKLPKHVIDNQDDGQQIEFVKNRTKYPEKFVEKVLYLYAHPDETSHDEVEFKDGTILDRHSAPVIGKDGTHFGRIWMFRDITERKQAEAALRATQEKATWMARLPEENPNPVLRASRDAAVLYANPAAVRAPGWGGAAGPLPGPVTLLLERAFAQGLEAEGDVALGDRVYAVWVFPLVGEGYANIYGRDITERKRAEEAMRESEARYRALFEASADGILITDDETRKFRYANRSMCRMLGYAEEELRTLGVQDIHPADDLQSIFVALESQSRGTTTTAFTLSCLRKDGAVFPAELSAAKLTIDGRTCHIAMFRDISERKLATNAVRSSELRYRRLFEAARDGILILDAETGTILDANPFLIELLGFSRANLLDKKVWDIGAFKDIAANQDKFAELQSRGHARYENLPLLAADGRSIDVEFVSNLYMVDQRNVIQCDIRDNTERKRAADERDKLRAQLEQSQKMESIGRLAGGVAHDFNNLLTAINGYAAFLLEGLAKDDPKREDVKEILAAGERAAGLTRQLLAFSRRQILNPRVEDINASVAGTVKMLKRLLGENIKIETKLSAQPCLAKVDAGQIDQVIINLAVNARDAMPHGGTLTLQTGIVTADADFILRRPDIPRGPLVCLSVCDTGYGMTDETKEHLFEPFYTTKEKGKGTGLGLSTVYGIIKQSGGEIAVESEPDHGTTFLIYFPHMGAEPKDKNKAKDEDKNDQLRGHETVLLVEDEDLIRRLGERALRAKGYAVLTAANGAAALQVIAQHGRPVDLLITDVVMPGMNGRALAREIAKRHMTRRTLYISGYTDNAIVSKGVLEPGLAFLYKPFSPNALLSKLRAVLDGPTDQAQA